MMKQKQALPERVRSIPEQQQGELAYFPQKLVRTPVGAGWLTAHPGEPMVARAIAARTIVGRDQFWIKEH